MFFNCSPGSEHFSVAIRKMMREERYKKNYYLLRSNIVIIKIARKLLNRIRFVLINQQPYEYGLVK